MQSSIRITALALLVVAWLSFSAKVVRSQSQTPDSNLKAGSDPAAVADAEATLQAAPPPAEETPAPKNPTDPNAKLRRLMPGYDVWIDPKNKQVLMQGEVCLTKGVLEMLSCLKGTKEHESVLTV